MPISSARAKASELTPYWKSECGRATVYVGDCRDVMLRLPRNTFHAIVTDPPYGLSTQDVKGSVNRFYNVLSNVVFPDFNKFNAEFLQQVDLSGIPLDGSALCWRRLSAIESRVHVPECSIDFHSDVVLDKEEVNTGAVPACGGISDRVLWLEQDEPASEFLGDYVLDFRDAKEFAACNSLGSCMAEFSLSFFAVPVVPVLLPGRTDPLTVLLQRQESSRRKRVRGGNYSSGGTVSPAEIVTSLGAVNPLVLRFALRGGTVELDTACGARQYDDIGKSACAKLVAAPSGTSSLPSMFKPHRVSVVGLSADRAYYLNIWMRHDWNSSLTGILPQSGGFMGKIWDSFTPTTSFFEAMLLVTKPGAHLLSFGGTRMWHRMACAIEDAGFDVRDTIMWCYGSGFPKSLDISKALDRMAGAERHTVSNTTDRRDDGTVYGIGHSGQLTSDEPITDAAKQWDGWGTALKPAVEPVIVARKPLVGTVAQNVLEHGCGGINVDGCRVGPVIDQTPGGLHRGSKVNGERTTVGSFTGTHQHDDTPRGRWPANLIHDGSDEVVGLFPQTGPTKPHSGDGKPLDTREQGWGSSKAPSLLLDNGGSAARFFKQCSPTEEDSRWLWNVLAKDVGTCSNQQREAVASVLTRVVARSTQRLVLQSQSVQVQNTSVSENQSRLVLESVIETIQSSERRSRLGLPPEKNTVRLGPVTCVATPSQTGTISTTISLTTSSHCVEVVTFDIMPICSEHGGQDSVRKQSRLHYTAKADANDRPHGKFDRGHETITIQYTTEEGRQCLVELRADMVTSPPKVIAVSGSTSVMENICRSWSTFLFGNECMAQFLKDTNSTTKMVTNSTTASRTLNWLMTSLTNASIPVANCEMESGGSHAANVERCNQSQLVITLGKTVSLPGVRNVASGTQLKISASVARPTVHPTCKPLDLMRYLVRLVCARGGVVLDPFMGSGSTGCAAIEEGMWFVGIEQSQEYADLAVGRLKLSLAKTPVGDKLTCGVEVRAKESAPPPPKRMRG